MMTADTQSLPHPERGWFRLLPENRESRDKGEQQRFLLLGVWEHPSSSLPFLLPAPFSPPWEPAVKCSGHGCWLLSLVEQGLMVLAVLDWNGWKLNGSLGLSCALITQVCVTLNPGLEILFFFALVLPSLWQEKA